MSHLRSLVAVAGIVLSLVVVGCGPTAEAIRTPRPSLLRPLPEAATAANVSPTPPGPPTPTPTAQPPGIATAMTGFPSTNAYQVTSATTTSEGFIAVGFGPMPDQTYYGLRQGIVWKSADGLTWQQSADSALQDTSPQHVVALSSDVYLFGDYSTCSDVDTACADESVPSLVVLKSSNGGAWQKLDQSADMTQATFDGVTAVNGRLVAFGAASDGTETVWTSSDGVSWAASTDLADWDYVDVVAAATPGLVAFGVRYDDASEDDVEVAATSADGAQFADATVPNIATATVMDVAGGPGGAVAVGWTETETSDTGLVLVSTDGQSWSQAAADESSFQDADLTAVHALSNGYVAVGGALNTEDFSYTAGRAWVSADGRTWRSLGDFGGTFSEYDASAVGPAGMVVFSSSSTEIGDEGDETSVINSWLLPASLLTR